MSRKWRWWLPGYVLQAPTFIIYLLLTLALYRPRSWQITDGVLTFIAGTKDGRTRLLGKPGGQCFGALIAGYASEAHRSKTRKVVHETCHTVQGMILGPLFLVIYVAHFAWRYARNAGHSAASDKAGRWWRAYRGICFEQMAYRKEAEFVLGGRPDVWGAR